MNLQFTILHAMWPRKWRHWFFYVQAICSVIFLWILNLCPLDRDSSGKPEGQILEKANMVVHVCLNHFFGYNDHVTILFISDGKLYATIRTSTKTWTVGAPGLRTGEWQTIDVSWHPEIGKKNIINNYTLLVKLSMKIHNPFGISKGNNSNS